MSHKTDFCQEEIHRKIEKVENQVVRCTEITCMYSSEDNKTCHKEKTTESDWRKVVNAQLDCDKDILLEVDTGDNQCCGLKDVQAVELVIAVQSAIKQRQELIEEWKNKTSCLTDQIEKLQSEKYTLEKSNLCKDSEIELLSKKLHELHKQYKILHHDSNKLKKELETLKCEYTKLSETYTATVCELKETKHKLANSIEREKELECRLKQQIHKNEVQEQNSQRLEEELHESRQTIKKLTVSLEETTKELLCIKKTLEEYKCVEKKLEILRQKYHHLKEKYHKIDNFLSQAYEENSSLKEVISKLNLTIENLTSDKDELIIAVQCLNNEKNCLLEQNSKLSRELSIFKTNISKLQNQLKCFEAEVDCLKLKIDDLENCNKTLYNELTNARQENRNLHQNLNQTVNECTTLSRALSEAQSQLECQQKVLLKVEAKVRTLVHEKQKLENIVGCLKDDLRTADDEINKLTADNSHVKNQNNDLICKLNKVTLDLNESITEIKHLEKEIEQLKHVVEVEREKHEHHIAKLQEKMRNKSREWKEYVTKEVTRLRNKRRLEIKKYLEINKDLENRLSECQEDAKRTEAELTENVMCLTRQLEGSRALLEETIQKAEFEYKELSERSSSEIHSLKELISKHKLESNWVIAELESKIQRLVEKNLDDEASIHSLSKENNCLKEKISKLHCELEQLKLSRAEIRVLIDTKRALECELANCQGLLGLAEKTTESLREENEQYQLRIKEEQELVKTLRIKLIKLKKIIGKKDAHIEVLNNTICQLKERLGSVTGENAELKSTICELEKKQNHLSDKIRSLNQELSDAKRALIEAGDGQKELLATIKQIECTIKKIETENMCLKNELQAAKENEYMAEKALQSSHKIQHELKDRVVRAETAALKSENEARTIECKLLKMQETIKKLESEISSLTDAYQYNDCQHRKKIEGLEAQLENASQEITLLRQQLEKSEKRVHRFKNLLKESQKALLSLASIFDSLRETLSQVLCIDYNPISLLNPCDKSIEDSRRIDFTEFVNSYKTEAEKYSESLVLLKNSETELACKLANTKKDFEKLSKIMKELQCEYMQKVEKLYQSLKHKEDLIKSQEKQLITIQLEAAGADEALAASLKNKIEDQYNCIKKLQEEKAILQNEILGLAKQVNSLESQIFELVEKLKLIEIKNSKLQMKNCALEGDLQKLELVLKEARDNEQEQISQYKEMILANRELMEKIRILKCQLDQGHHEIEELRHKKSHDAKCCAPSKSHKCDMDLEIEIHNLTEKLEHSKRAEKEAKCAFFELEKNLSKIQAELAESQGDKANLEGWVGHLQQLISGGYIADSTLPTQLHKVESEKKTLEKTIDSLKCSISNLLEEKKHFKHTIDNLSKCNVNLQETIDSISKNKCRLEKELKGIQKKVDGLSCKSRTTDSDLTSCTKDISCMIENACSITKNLKCQESQCHFSGKSSTPKVYTSPYEVRSDLSYDEIAVSVGCQNITTPTDSTDCCVRHFECSDISRSRASRTHNQSVTSDIKIDESCSKKSSTGESVIQQKVKKSQTSSQQKRTNKTFV